MGQRYCKEKLGGIMHRFFVEPHQISDNQIKITGQDVNHIKNVLRMKVGQNLCVSDQDKKEYACYIEEFQDEFIILHIKFVEEVGLELPSKIYLFQGLPKNDKMELIIQKAVELGAFQMIPVATKRAVVKLDKKKEVSKLKRWQAISESAAKQAKRMYIPKVTPCMTFKEAINYGKDLDIKLIPYELAKGMEETRKILKGIEPGKSIGIFIGPEGGFDEEEIKLALEHNIKPITLGKRILRTETAGFTVLSILMYLLEEDTKR